MLEAMKEMRALDTSHDGKITKSEFNRLYSQNVLIAAAVKLRAGPAWTGTMALSTHVQTFRAHAS